VTEFDCADCGVDTNLNGEYYMVNDDMWETAAEDVVDGMLCIGCLEDRIGRELELKDFADVLLNNIDMGWRKSDRLIERLLRG
jgi:hypothetical protein